MALSANDYRILLIGELDTSVLDYGVSLNCYISGPTQVLIEFMNTTNEYGMNMP